MTDQTTVITPEIQVLLDRTGWSIVNGIPDGSFGIVHTVEDKTGRQEAIISFQRTEEKYQEAQNELTVKNLIGDHLHFCFINECYQTIDRIVYRFSFFSETDICSYFRSRRLSDRRKRDLLGGVLLALSHLHSMNYVHRNIQPEVILVVGGTSKLARFQQSKHLVAGQNYRGPAGAEGYRAPENINDNDFFHQSDVFCLGLVFHKVLHHKDFLNPKLNEGERWPKAYNTAYPFTNLAFAAMLTEMTQFDETKRKSAEQCYRILTNEHLNAPPALPTTPTLAMSRKAYNQLKSRELPMIILHSCLNRNKDVDVKKIKRKDSVEKICLAMATNFGPESMKKFIRGIHNLFTVKQGDGEAHFKTVQYLSNGRIGYKSELCIRETTSRNELFKAVCDGYLSLVHKAGIFPEKSLEDLQLDMNAFLQAFNNP